MAFYKSFSDTTATPIGKWIVNTKYNSLIKSISKQIDLEGATVLEIGPGTGEFSDKLRELGVDVHMIEPNSYLKEILGKKGYTKIENYSVPPLTAENNTYDLIVMINVFEHLHNHENAVHMMKELKRTLKDDGILAVNTPEVLFFGLYFWEADYTHNYVTTRNRFEQMFIDFEMKVEVKRLYSGPIHGWWTPLISYFMRSLFFIDLISSFKIRKKINKLRFSLLTNVFFIARKQKNSNEHN